MSEENQKPQIPDFRSMSIEEKLEYLHIRALSTDSALASYIRYNKHDDKFKRHYNKEQEALRVQHEQRVKDAEKKAKVEKIDK